MAPSYGSTMKTVVLCCCLILTSYASKPAAIAQAPSGRPPPPAREWSRSDVDGGGQHSPGERPSTTRARLCRHHRFPPGNPGGNHTHSSTSGRWQSGSDRSTTATPVQQSHSPSLRCKPRRCRWCEPVWSRLNEPEFKRLSACGRPGDALEPPPPATPWSTEVGRGFESASFLQPEVNAETMSGPANGETRMERLLPVLASLNRVIRISRGPCPEPEGTSESHLLYRSPNRRPTPPEACASSRVLSRVYSV